MFASFLPVSPDIKNAECWDRRRPRLLFGPLNITNEQSAGEDACGPSTRLLFGPVNITNKQSTGGDACGPSTRLLVGHA